MKTLLMRYLQGFHQEVYDELLESGEQALTSPLYEEAQTVMRELMRRVRYNLEHVLLPRLHVIDYRFADGVWGEEDDLPDARREALQRQ